jgi:hypothetical protein
VAEPIVVLLLPRTLEQFILRDTAEDLLKAPGVVAVEPGRLPYGAFGRLPEAVGEGIARRQARRLVRALPGRPAAVVVFHPLQWPLARALCAAVPDCQVWYSRWDRYEQAYDASPWLRLRLERLHAEVAAASAFTFAVSDRLAELEREAGREAHVVSTAADRFPAPDPGRTVVAISLGHLGWRTDWALLRAVAERMGPDLVLLLVGDWHEDEVGEDPDFRACRALPSLVWLGRRSDEEAARLILCADVGIVPFRVEPFNDAGLPNRILKYARLGRRTVAPDLAGARTWGHAVTFARDPEHFAEALRAHAGTRTRPDAELRAWALAQTAERQNAPLRERMQALGVRTA